MVHFFRRLIKGFSQRLASRLDLVLENIALRHQLMVLQRPRRSSAPHLTGVDRLFWSLLSRQWPRWREALLILQPETVKRWQKTSWWQHLRGRRRRRSGRPPIDAELRNLILRITAENWLWGSMRVCGELRNLGFTVSNTTVRRYRRLTGRNPACQSWSTFRKNHAAAMWQMVEEELGRIADYAVDRLRRLSRRRQVQPARLRGSDNRAVVVDLNQRASPALQQLTYQRAEGVTTPPVRAGPDKQITAA